MIVLKSAPPFGYANTKSPLTTNQQTSFGWVLPVSTTKKKQPNGNITRSGGRSSPCPRRWVICSQKMLFQSDLAGERSQFAAENKIASERTFVRFFSTQHESLRITVGRWQPKETLIRSTPAFSERMKCIGDHLFVAACSSDLRIRRRPQRFFYVGMAFPLDFPNVELSDFVTFA
ncbi:hypothetical protein ES319_D04G103800v1 [Gossypium barbadense]|uniref:Uncharacterized protein n=1 Tax=Gossypium barbadense TaxID=3634 RepID=A0A5J5RYC1_GOSBA|nr:hypothetical protein ES319_D04G103800v1 [Gossypium barbadense]